MDAQTTCLSTFYMCISLYLIHFLINLFFQIYLLFCFVQVPYNFYWSNHKRYYFISQSFTSQVLLEHTTSLILRNTVQHFYKKL